MTPDTVKEIQKGQSIKDAFAALAEALSRENSGHGVLALPGEFHVHDLERYMPVRRRMRGSMTTHSIKSFLDYCVQHGTASSSQAFVDPDAMQAVAVFDRGANYAPGHCEHTASLVLTTTAEFTALTKMLGYPVSQQKMAEFFEDWRDYLQFWDAVDADAQPIPFHKAVGAIRRLTIESARKVESVEKNLGASMSAFESVEATSTEPIPQLVYFKCKPYADLGERTFVMRLAVITSNDKPTVCLKAIRLETHQQEMGEEFAALLNSTGFPVFLGKFSGK